MHRWILSAALLVAAALFVAPAPTAAQDSKAEAPALTAVQKSNVAVLDALIRNVRQSFYDKKYCGLDLNKLREKYLKAVTDSPSGAPLHKVLNQLIAEFKVSHFGVMEGDVYSVNFVPEMNNTFSVRPGFDIGRIHGEYFVANVYQDSAAEHGGLLRGDRLVLVNGQPIEESPLLVDAGSDPGIPGEPHFFLRVPDDMTELSLGVQRKRGDEKLTAITLKPTAINMIYSTKKSVSVIEYKGRKFGYIRFWHFLHDGMTSALRNAIRKDWKDCEGAIIDLRGRGGSPMVMNACFAPFGTPPALGRMFGGGSYNMPRWEKPVIALQDSGSRSAKEIYAHNWKYLKIGPIVGETTPGAVLGSSFVELPDGSQMIMPMQDAAVYCYGNVRLEANGVAPTHAVKDLLAYSAGVDTIKEAGIKVIYDLVKDYVPAKPEAAPEKKPAEDKDEEEQFFVAASNESRS
ncbi:carboxyl-terminal processing protease [uncultured bacterium]|nr:carboxyl-terminal processing protease [uncultured bacterium]